MPWILWATGGIQQLSATDIGRVVSARAGSTITDAQASTALARGSTTAVFKSIAGEIGDRSAFTPAEYESELRGGMPDPDETNGEPEMAQVPSNGEGDDLRDNGRTIDEFYYDEEQGRLVEGQPGDATDDALPGGVAQASLGGLGVVALAYGARAALRTIMGTATRITAAHWSALPSWARTALAAIGLGVGIDLATQLPVIPGESMLVDVFQGGGLGPGAGPGGTPGVAVVGTWTANGVKFYRLSDGRLAVQNKMGRWKVWRPKKPIVLMPGGANNLRTLLKADRLLNAQAKRIAAMLNRRSPRSRRSAGATKKDVVIVQNDGKSALLG